MVGLPLLVQVLDLSLAPLLYVIIIGWRFVCASGSRIYCRATLNSHICFWFPAVIYFFVVSLLTMLYDLYFGLAYGLLFGGFVHYLSRYVSPLYYFLSHSQLILSRSFSLVICVLIIVSGLHLRLLFELIYAMKPKLDLSLPDQVSFFCGTTIDL